MASDTASLYGSPHITISVEIPCTTCYKDSSQTYHRILCEGSVLALLEPVWSRYKKSGTSKCGLPEVWTPHYTGHFL